ncbi:MAG: hypothetical protein PHP54_01970 [Clostridia bacterium]|nr:hypothetical protein [Clostridia bacterium]
MHKKIKYTLIIAFFLLLCAFSSNDCFALTQKEVGDAVAQFSVNFANNYGVNAMEHGKENQTYYSWDWDDRCAAYNGKKTTGTFSVTGNAYTNKYAMDCVGWIAFAYRYAIGYVNEGMKNSGSSYPLAPPITPGDNAVGGSGVDVFELVTDGSIRPGDILGNDTHVWIYINPQMCVESRWYFWW